MSQHVFDSTSFRSQFPAFAATATYPDATLAIYWTMATQYISPNDGAILTGDVLQLALNLMTAHIAQVFTQLGNGQQTVVVSGSSEGSVSVSLEPPPAKTAWQWWLSTTAYGQQLRALLGTQTAGGTMAGGSLERASFRKAGGLW